MSRNYLVSGLLALSAIAVPAASAQEAADTLTLSLDNCIAIALSESPTIKVADMEIKRYDYSRKETLGQLLPTVNFGATYNRTLAKQVAYMNMKGFGALAGGGTGDSEGSVSQEESPAKNNGIKMGLDNSYSMGFNASMPLIAPQLWKMLKLSDSQILESVENARSSRLSLINQVKNAYFTLLLTRDSYEVIKANYEMAKFTADLYAKKFKVGAASEFDVLRTEVAVKNVEPELLQSQIAIKQAMLQLRILMGLDPDLPLKPDVSLKDYEKSMYEPIKGVSHDNITGNADLRLFDVRTRQLENALDVKKMAWYPTLALTANYNWTSSSDGSPFKNFRWTPYSVVGLTFSLPLYQGGQRYYAIQEAKIQVEEMKWQRENLVRSINMQVDLSVDNINKNIRQISSSSESVAQAIKAHDIMKSSFEIGAASYLDLRDSELALTRSRLSYLESIYNYLVAQAGLELLLGSDIAPEEAIK